MKSYLLEAIAKHLGEHDAALEYDSEDRKYLRQLFVQHAFLLNAIESEPECQELVEKVMASFMADQRVELKPAADESPKIITPDRF
jgi:hypothetical protein